MSLTPFSVKGHHYNDLRKLKSIALNDARRVRKQVELMVLDDTMEVDFWNTSLLLCCAAKEDTLGYI